MFVVGVGVGSSCIGDACDGDCDTSFGAVAVAAAVAVVHVVGGGSFVC